MCISYKYTVQCRFVFKLALYTSCLSSTCCAPSIQIKSNCIHLCNSKKWLLRPMNHTESFCKTTFVTIYFYFSDKVHKRHCSSWCCSWCPEFGQMADCSYARCLQERRSIKRELQRWTKNMVYVVGESEICQSSTIYLCIDSLSGYVLVTVCP